MEELYVGTTDNWEHMLPKESMWKLKISLPATKVVYTIDGTDFYRSIHRT